VSLEDLPDDPEDQLDDQTLAGIYKSTYQHLPTFIDLIFCDSFEGFTRGEWVLTRAKFMQGSQKTCHIGPRNHFKSTGIYAHWLWRMWQARFNASDQYEWADGPATLEAHYFSYKEKSASYHIGQASDSICALVERNPWFSSLQDLKPQAETKGKWTWNGQHTLSITPHGMLSHVRGIHGDICYIDDPFQDPDSKGQDRQALNPTKILKINYIFKTAIKGIPNPGDEMHIVTTPQTEEDFVFDEALMEEFDKREDPAIQDHQSEHVLWSEWMDYQHLLQEKSEIGQKLFNQEYMVQPMSREVGFFSEQEVSDMVQPGLQDLDAKHGLTVDPHQAGHPPQPKVTLGFVAGLDIGKKRHPAHLAVFRVVPTEEQDQSRLIQVHSRWMDNWDYVRQVEYCKTINRYLGIDRLLYDNTRGEFESIEEMGRLPGFMKGVTLSGKTQDKMSTYFDVAATDDRLHLLPEDRQERQILAVSNDLEAVETDEGHGESFYSVGLSVMAENQTHFGNKVKSLET